MKVLYAIQGTGNGHLARATEIVPVLQKMAETDVLVSGIQGDIQLPFEVKYRFYGVSFIFGTTGGVDLKKTIAKSRLPRFLVDLIKLPVQKYDLVISDFEPVSAWACKVKGKKCIGLSHQNAVLHNATPKPEKHDALGKFILRNYAPVSLKYGFHFNQLDSFNFSPVIRNAIRNANHSTNNHYSVYLPSYSNEEIERVLGAFPQVQWEVFSKHSQKSYSKQNIHFQPVSIEKFHESFISCSGILCNAGFETPAEALHMGKKLCVIPMKNQYEQQCNAAFLREMGVQVLNDLSEDIAKIRLWLENIQPLKIDFPDRTIEIIEKIIMRNTI